MMDDLISRAAALNAYADLYWMDERMLNFKKEIDTVYDKIRNLASVQPERKTDENNHYKTGYDQGFVDACKMYEKKQPERKTDGDTISRHQTIDALMQEFKRIPTNSIRAKTVVENLPSAQPEYEPVTAEDFAKTMSDNTLYGFMAWHGEALELMERHGFVICKKTM